MLYDTTIQIEFSLIMEISVEAAESARLRWHRNGREELPKSEVRGGGREDQPHVQGAVAARAQEGLEELSHVEGQEGQW